MIRRRDLIIFAAAIIGVIFYVIAAGANGFPLDDSWIHQTYARNLASLGYFTYAPPYAPSAGSTSPLYTLLLAIGHGLHLPYLAWTYGLGALALALLGIIGAHLAERLYPELEERGVGLITGLALVMAWHLVWAASSGMETVLFSLFSLLVIALIWVEKEAEGNGHLGRGALFGVTAGALIATRPDGALLLALAGLFAVIAPPPRSRRGLLLWMAGAAIGFTVAIAPYLTLNYSLNHTLVPNTAAAKQAENSFALSFGFPANFAAMIQPLAAGGQLLVIPGAIVTLVRVARQIRGDRRAVLFLLPLGWAFAHIALYAALLPAPYQHGRYVIPALPPFLVFGVGGMVSLISTRRVSRWGRVLVRSLVLTALGVFLIFWYRGAGVFAQDVGLIQSDMVAASRWLAANIPADGLLAVHDIGAVGYFAPRPMIDIAGLITPEIVPAIRRFASGDLGAYKPFLRDHGAAYLMVLENQWPDPDHDPDLCLLYNAHGGMGGMRVYRITWGQPCMP
ncbi:MAG TPA: hypothetical protein VMT34_15105 [Aggregatilineales bacterium]|nr:hypothetical protein [Aggregatilineales bacterium]